MTCRKDLLLAGSLVVFFLLAAGFCVSLAPSRSLAEKAQIIKRGDSKEKVQKMLGEPTEIYLPRLLGVNYETWAYGHSFRLSPNFPYFTRSSRSFQFHPETNEICISFDSRSNVINVYIPGINLSTK